MSKKDVVLDFMSGVQTWTKPMRKIKLIDHIDINAMSIHLYIKKNTNFVLILHITM